MTTTEKPPGDSTEVLPPAAPTGHPIVWFAARLGDVLDGLGEAPTWSMTPAEQRQVLVQLGRAQARVEELRLRVLAAADHADVAAQSASTSTGAWLAHATGQGRTGAHRDVQLALALEDHHATRNALARGVLGVEHARVVVAALQRLRREAPEAVAADPSVLAAAEQHLVAAAVDPDTADPADLARLGRHVLEVLDPEGADRLLGRRLAAEEAAAARATYLQLHDNGDGSHTGRFKISTLTAAMLRTALEAFTNPTHRGRHRSHPSGCSRQLTTPGVHDSDRQPDEGCVDSREALRRRRSRPELLGEAFTELIERLDPTRLPHSGGVNATVVVQLDYERLLDGLGTARLDTGGQISAGEARRLACQAGIIPAVVRRLVGGRSVVLDVGRTRRLHTPAQRIALGLQQGGCTADGCRRPPAWCHTHHDVPWARGGSTDLSNGRLLCPHHHRKAHHPNYRTERLPNGTLSFHRRT